MKKKRNRNEQRAIKATGKLTHAGEYIIVVVVVTKLGLTLCDTMDCNSLGSSIHGIFQARVLEWVAISFLNLGSNLHLLGRWTLFH